MALAVFFDAVLDLALVEARVLNCVIVGVGGVGGVGGRGGEGVEGVVWLAGFEDGFEFCDGFGEEDGEGLEGV